MIVEDGISIPSSYTSWLAPIQCPKLHTEVRATRDKDKHPDVSYNISYVIWKPLLCQQSHCTVLPHSNHNPPFVTSWNNVGPLCNWLGCEDFKMFGMYKPSRSLIQLLLPQAKELPDTLLESWCYSSTEFLIWSNNSRFFSKTQFSIQFHQTYL